MTSCARGTVLVSATLPVLNRVRTVLYQRRMVAGAPCACGTFPHRATSPCGCYVSRRRSNVSHAKAHQTMLEHNMRVSHTESAHIQRAPAHTSDNPRVCSYCHVLMSNLIGCARLTQLMPRARCKCKRACGTLLPPCLLRQVAQCSVPPAAL